MAYPALPYMWALVQGSNFDQLRATWFQRFCNSKDCLKIFAHLQKGSRDPALTVAELSPYIADLVKWLGLYDHADDVLVVTPGQPFRLKLWKHLALAMHDPDVQLLDTLQVGVPLGENSCSHPQRGRSILIALQSQLHCRTALSGPRTGPG